MGSTLYIVWLGFQFLGFRDRMYLESSRVTKDDMAEFCDLPASMSGGRKRSNETCFCFFFRWFSPKLMFALKAKPCLFKFFNQEAASRNPPVAANRTLFFVLII